MNTEGMQELYDVAREAVTGVGSDYFTIQKVVEELVLKWRPTHHPYFQTTLVLIILCAIREVPLSEVSFRGLQTLLTVLASDPKLGRRTIGDIRKKIRSQPQQD
jgi:hypothetical protein